MGPIISAILHSFTGIFVKVQNKSVLKIQMIFEKMSANFLQKLLAELERLRNFAIVGLILADNWKKVKKKSKLLKNENPFISIELTIGKTNRVQHKESNERSCHYNFHFSSRSGDARFIDFLKGACKLG